jgi:hypothetical protein
LFFLLWKNSNISLQPRISSCNNCPIQPLAAFLYQLLQSLFENFSRSTTFINAGDFIQKLEQYCIQSDCLLPKTNFVTFKIHNLHKRVSYDDILLALNQFLITQQPNILRHQRLSNDTIVNLTQIFLQNNIFSYHGKIYRHIKGCPLNFRLSRLLFNIYLHNWQLPLVRQIRLADEFYGRYDNIGFFTWCGSTENLEIHFNELNYQHPDVQITRSTGLNVHFLNIYIENRKGNLYTRVYRDPNKQLFLLPYVTNGHPRLIHRQWFQYVLIRAGQSCTLLEDFQTERLYIELTFLANGYSLDFVEYHLKNFYKRFNNRHQQQQQQSILDRSSYMSLRRQLFRHLDIPKRQLEEREQLKKDHRWIELYYLYDWGLRYKFNENFHKLWSTILERDVKFKKYGLKIKLYTKHCYLSNSILTDS